MGRRLDPEVVRRTQECLAAGLNPMRAAAAAGVSKTFAYDLDRAVSGVSRLAARRAAGALMRDSVVHIAVVGTTALDRCCC